MSRIIEIGIMHIFQIVFFTGIAGCVVTVLTSWYSICRGEFTPDAPAKTSAGGK